jgi:superfamily I DNA/RNA helicase
MASKENKAAYDPGQEIVTVLTVHSSKGLEFDTVVLAGIDRIGNPPIFNGAFR